MPDLTLTDGQQRFVRLLQAPCLRDYEHYWDFNTCSLDVERLQRDLNVLSQGNN